MDIDKMSDWEKSVMLAQAMGWQPVPYRDPLAQWWREEKVTEHGPFWDATSSKIIIRPERMNMYVGIEDSEGKRVSRGDQPYDDDNLEKHWRRCPDIYDPANMGLAWRVLNWAYARYADEEFPGFINLIRTDLLWYLYELPPADAQRAWLDKILELCIEAGLVGAEAE